MHNKLDIIIENAKKAADILIQNTASIRENFAKGRPNSSVESTVDGTLKAFAALVNGFNPGYTLKK